MSADELVRLCPKYDCRNRGRPCFRCQGDAGGFPLYHRKVDRMRRKNSRKEGMSFERRVGKVYEKRIGSKARQMPNSGATWFMPGDVNMDEFLSECKERKLTSRGEKQFTVTREMLDKIDMEAGVGKPGVIVFGFKGDSNVYLITKYDTWLSLIHDLNMLRSGKDGATG